MKVRLTDTRRAAGGHPETAVGSLTKVTWPGLRIGWIRAREALIERLVRIKAITDEGTSLPSQTMAVAILGDLPRIAQARHRRLSQCLRHASDLLKDLLPDGTWTAPKGGQSLWVRLPAGDADSFSQHALKHGVTVIPGTLFPWTAVMKATFGSNSCNHPR